MKHLTSAEVVAENLEYIDKRRKGEIRSLLTKYPKVNSVLMGGVELDTITCISALSGAGKSTLSKTFRDSFVDLNPDEKFKQYCFNFEMLAHQQIGRSISTLSKTKLRKLYSVDEPLSDEEFEKLKKYYDDLANREIYFIEVAGTPEEIANTIVSRWYTDCKPVGATIVYEIDHALLVRGRDGKGEKERIDELMYLLVDVKKYIAANGGHSVGIVLSQMNREIRDVKRVTNKGMHRPDTSCLFGASSIEMCCDYILFSHIPAKVNLATYTSNDLPTRIKVNDEVIQMVYFELVKQRSGASDITIPVWNKLAVFDFEEMDSGIFNNLLDQMRTGDKVCIPEVKLQKSLFE